MTNVNDLTRRIAADFGRYLRRSGHDFRTLNVFLPQILRRWVALPTWREHFSIETLLPHEWVEIETAIVSKYRKRWQANAANTRAATKKRNRRAAEKARQLTLDL